MKIRTTLGILALGLAATFAMDAPANAQGFYDGKTITLVVGASNRGTYAAYSRILGIHMGKHIPGNPKIVLSVKGGASGGMVAANFMNNAVPKDGSVIGITQQTIPVSQFLRPGKGRYDASNGGGVGRAQRVRGGRWAGGNRSGGGDRLPARRKGFGRGPSPRAKRTRSNRGAQVEKIDGGCRTRGA